MPGEQAAAVSDRPCTGAAGEVVVFVADIGQDAPRIHRLSADGRATVLIDGPGSTAPSYLPDGRVLFVREDGPGTGSGDPPRGAIRTMEADGTDQRQLLPRDQPAGWAEVERAVASPDGEWVAFSGIVGDDLVTELDGIADPRRLYETTAYLRNVSWAPGRGVLASVEGYEGSTLPHSLPIVRNARQRKLDLCPWPRSPARVRSPCRWRYGRRWV